MPQAAIAQSIAIAALPTFSAQVAKNKIDEMRISLSASLRAVLLLSIPATVGLIMLRKPIVALLYGGKAFGADSVDLVSWALLWYSIGLVGHCLVEVISRAFYALHDTKTPVIVGVGAMTGNLMMSFVFGGLFTKIGWMPHGGLALANSSATIIECIILLLLMKKKLAGLHERSITEAISKSVVASLGLVGVILLVGKIIGIEIVWKYLVVSIVSGLFVYGFLLIMLGSSDVKTIIPMVLNKITRKKTSN